MEWVDLVDLHNRAVGRAPRSLVRRHNLLHRGIGVLCRRPRDGAIFVHQRTATKDLFPSLFDMFVGGVVEAGEDYQTAALREVAEELGVEGVPLVERFDHLYLGDRNRSWVKVYEVEWSGPISCQPEEICWGEWMAAAQVPTWAEQVEVVPDGLSLFREHFQRFPEFWLDPA